ncbi:MAG: NAD(+)/NADH kinase [Desulfobacteraceae bacterium]|nr:NAD(+)/NADH kinase [Desulfobacteraceae bacterium]
MAPTIGLVVKPDAAARQHADALEQWLQAKGCAVVRVASDASPLSDARPGQNPPPKDLAFVVVLGGDGTFLSAVRWLGDHQVPLLGIKFGELGFLAEAGEEQINSAVEMVLNNQYSTRPRMRLEVEVWQDQNRVAGETVLNDVVINKGALARLALIKTFVNDRYLTDYRADGLIVATPTGSTAYSLSAGGPIMHPHVPGILITPICPFTLTNRPMIVPDTAQIKIQLTEKSADIMLTFDGQVGLPIDEHHVITVRKAASPVQLITLPGRSFFDVLRTKLKWGGSRP